MDTAAKCDHPFLCAVSPCPTHAFTPNEICLGEVRKEDVDDIMIQRHHRIPSNGFAFPFPLGCPPLGFSDR
jgi:hypothetical protein